MKKKWLPIGLTTLLILYFVLPIVLFVCPIPYIQTNRYYFVPIASPGLIILSLFTILCTVISLCRHSRYTTFYCTMTIILLSYGCILTTISANSYRNFLNELLRTNPNAHVQISNSTSTYTGTVKDFVHTHPNLYFIKSYDTVDKHTIQIRLTNPENANDIFYTPS